MYFHSGGVGGKHTPPPPPHPRPTTLCHTPWGQGTRPEAHILATWTSSMVTTSSNCSRNFSVKAAKLAMKNRLYFRVNSWRKHGEHGAAGRGTCLQRQAEGGFGEQHVRQDQGHVSTVSKLTGIWSSPGGLSLEGTWFEDRQ